MLRSLARWVILLLSLSVAAYGVFAYLALTPGTTVHPAMKPAYAAHPTRIVAHVVFSATALLTGPFQFFPSLRRRLRIHRLLGYVYFVGVFGGAVAGLATALIAYGGLVARVGFGALAVAWLVSTGVALAAICRRNFVQHERWTMRSFALTFAAVTLRLYLGAGGAAGLPFEEFYPVVAWLCWVPNLIFVEWVLLARRPAHA